MLGFRSGVCSGIDLFFISMIMPYEIYETETFSKLYSAMKKEEREWVDKIKVQLKNNPNVGKET